MKLSTVVLVSSLLLALEGHGARRAAGDTRRGPRRWSGGQLNEVLEEIEDGDGSSYGRTTPIPRSQRASEARKFLAQNAGPRAAANFDPQTFRVMSPRSGNAVGSGGNG